MSGREAVPLSDATLTVSRGLQLAVKRRRQPFQPDESGSADWGGGFLRRGRGFHGVRQSAAVRAGGSLKDVTF